MQQQGYYQRNLSVEARLQTPSEMSTRQARDRRNVVAEGSCEYSKEWTSKILQQRQSHRLLRANEALEDCVERSGNGGIRSETEVWRKSCSGLALQDAAILNGRRSGERFGIL